MLFNDYVFIFAFLPIVLVGFYLVGLRSSRGALAWLTISSFVFYAWWRPVYLALLLPSIVMNYLIGRRLGSIGPKGPRKAVMVLGVALNLGLLGYFKYAGFLVSAANAIAGTHVSIGSVVLPLGISFFTFTQIAYLVDAYSGKTDPCDLPTYALFVSFFPHLIAGPIVHHWQVIPQFRRLRFRFDVSDFGVGLSIFLIGLFEKVLIADAVCKVADPVFAIARHGGHPGLGLAWSGTLAYAVQIYFDFAGYSDMAIGLARMFGCRFPVNFNSPYKAASVVDFWRRWHMTLSKFLMEYLYIPLGGNRRGRGRRYINLMITMLLGGLWHGAAWSFVIWGGLHGFFLTVNWFWRDIYRRRHDWRIAERLDTPLGRALGRAITFAAVSIAWVLFRSADLGTTSVMLKSMVGAHGVGVPGPAVLPRVALMFICLAWAFWGPNTQEIMADAAPALDAVTYSGWRVRRPGIAFFSVLGFGLFFVIRTYFAAAPSPFLYFNF